MQGRRVRLEYSCSERKRVIFIDCSVLRHGRGGFTAETSCRSTAGILPEIFAGILPPMTEALSSARRDRSPSYYMRPTGQTVYHIISLQLFLYIYIIIFFIIISIATYLQLYIINLHRFRLFIYHNRNNTSIFFFN